MELSETSGYFLDRTGITLRISRGPCTTGNLLELDHLADFDVDEIVVRVDVLSHQASQLQEVWKELPLMLHIVYPRMPVQILQVLHLCPPPTPSSGHVLEKIWKVMRDIRAFEALHWGKLLGGKTGYGWSPD